MSASTPPGGLAGKLRALAPRLVFLAVGLLLGGLLVGVCAKSSPRSDATHVADGGSSKPGTIWTCAMHPQVRRTEPGTCPLCPMKLIPVTTEEESARGRIALSDRAKALAQIQTVAVHRTSDGGAELQLLGRIEADESSLRTVTAWIGGRIDRLHVTTTGTRVGAGQTIATMYSPEVFTAHQDLLVAKRQKAQLAAGSPTAQKAAESALEAARQRLRLLGVPDAELARMENADQPTRAVAIRTPFGGTVLERIATEGSYVTTGTPLYRMADLSRVWIQLDAYESDLPRIAVGQTVRLTVDALVGETLEGKVTFIDPTLDPKKRTARVRVVTANRDGKLRPGMFAQAVLVSAPKDGADAPLVIPRTAPLFTGKRSIVYVEVGEGDRNVYDARVVRLGPLRGDVYPVVAGLSAGERVVVRGAFVLDADLQIRGGPSMMNGPDDTREGPWQAAIRLPQAELARLAPIVTAYLEIQRALAADNLAAAGKAASALVEALGKVKIERPAEAKTAYGEISTALRAHAHHTGHAASLEAARQGFEGLSAEMERMLRTLGNPTNETLVLAHCPMAFGSRGASWIQQGEGIDNAYFGSSMRTCGSVVKRVKPSEHLPSSPPSAEKPPPTKAPGHQH